jgi:hypothetical protein
MLKKIILMAKLLLSFASGISYANIGTYDDQIKEKIEASYQNYLIQQQIVQESFPEEKQSIGLFSIYMGLWITIVLGLELPKTLNDEIKSK